MAVAWFIVPYTRRDRDGRPSRYCSMDDFTPDIVADGGGWAETEVLGNFALVKVVAKSRTIQAIGGTSGFTRIPLQRLTDPLSTFSAQVRNAIQNRLLAMGHAQAEVDSIDWVNGTLLDLLKLVASKRRLERFDAASNSIVCDGQLVAPVPPEVVDAKVV